MYKKGSMPNTKQISGPGSAPRHLLAPGTKPPERIHGPNKHDVPQKGYSASYRQGGRKGGNEASS